MRNSFDAKLNRHPHPRAQPAERACIKRDVAAVRARDVARDGETQAGAALVLVARVVESEARLEHLLPYPRGNAGPVVIDGNGEIAVVTMTDDLDRLGKARRV